MGRYWVLDGHDLRVVDMEEWSRWYGSARDERVVRQDRLMGDVFETMVFAKGDDDWSDYCRRYPTWETAERGHYEVLAAVALGLEQP